MQKELSTTQNIMAKQKFNDYASKAIEIAGGKLFVAKLDKMEPNTLKKALSF